MSTDYLLFEEAIDEILTEHFGGRSRWDLDEDETWALHEEVKRRVCDKHVGLYSKVLFDHYNRG